MNKDFILKNLICLYNVIFYLKNSPQNTPNNLHSKILPSVSDQAILHLQAKHKLS